MTRSHGGGFGGSTHNSGGRSHAGNFGPPSHSHRPLPLPPPHHHHPHPHILPPLYAPVPIIYATGAPVYSSYQTSVGVTHQYDARTKFLNKCNALFAFIMMALLIGSLWLYTGPYGYTRVQLGLHSSRLLTANSIFARSMQVTTFGDVGGPSIFGFNKKPPLNQAINWTDSFNLTVHPYEEKDYAFWLNKGSVVKVNYNIRDKLFGVIFAVLRGRAAFDSWQASRGSSPSSRTIHGQGSIGYELPADDDYYFAVGNVNPKVMQVSLEVEFHSLAYSTEGASQQCSLHSKLCQIQLSFFHSNYGVLATPNEEEWGVDVWDFEVSYGVRWMTLIVIYGTVIFIFLAAKASLLRSTYWYDPGNPEQAPLVLPEEVSIAGATVRPSAPQIPEEAPGFVKEELSDDQLCSVCLDAPKDSFFDPCGHRATCYSCGLRILNEDPHNCPICRQPIKEVRRIFDS